MNIPEGLFYTKSHEWVRREGDVAIMGITDFAQSSLGDIVFVDLPEVGRSLVAGSSFASVDSVKTSEEIMAPLSGEVTAVNEALREGPETMNADPYDKGWIITFRPSDPAEYKALMPAAQYVAYVSELASH